MKPPLLDVLGANADALEHVLFPDSMLLPVMFAVARYGCGLELWPTETAPARKEVQRAALS